MGQWESEEDCGAGVNSGVHMGWWEGRSLTKRKRVDWEEGEVVMKCRDTEREVGGF